MIEGEDSASFVRAWLESHEDFTDAFALQWVLSRPKLIRAVLHHGTAHHGYGISSWSHYDLRANPGVVRSSSVPQELLMEKEVRSSKS